MERKYPVRPTKQQNTNTQPRAEEAPLGATPEERIENGAASQEDLMDVAPKVESGETIVSPEAEAEMREEGLLPPQPQEGAGVNDDNENGEQPPAAGPQQGAGAGVNDDNAQNLANEITNAPGNDQKSLIKRVMESFGATDAAKKKMSTLFQAYKDGDIDKAQYNYFLADAISRAANNIGEIIEANRQNSMWANITSGKQVTPKIDLSDNEWQKYLKSDWQSAQKLKQDTLRTEIEGKVTRDAAALEAANKQHIALNVNPAIYESSLFAKMDPETRIKCLTFNGLANGAPVDDKDIATALDVMAAANTAKSKKEQELQKLLYDNDYSKLNNAVKGIEANIAQRTEDIKVQYEQGKLTEQEYNNAIKQQESLQATIKTYVDDQLKETRVGKEKAELVNTKYKGMTFQLNLGIPGLGNAGAHVDAAALIHAGYDIKALLDKKGLTLSAEHEQNANEAAGLAPGAGGTF